MAGTFFASFCVVILSILAHASRKFAACDTVLRIAHMSLTLMFFFMGLDAIHSSTASPWAAPALLIGSLICVLIQFKPVRSLLPPLLTPINQIVIGRPFIALCGRLRTSNLRPEIGCGDNTLVVESGEKEEANKSIGPLASLRMEKIFLPESIPHLNGLWCYTAILALCISEVRPDGFGIPALMHLPILRPLFESYFDTLCEVIMAAFGVGLLMTRNLPQVLLRLGLVKPKLIHVALAFTVAVLTFSYDCLWSLYTHSSAVSSHYPSVMSQFNEGTYLAGGDAWSAFQQALTTGLCAGLDEEILFRGAIQPVLGIVPSAFLHALMHQQFSGAPLFILQIFIWSAAMGVIKRYTNTTTTVIAHATFNFMQVFLIGFNP